jgi:hypothetical protein
MKSTLVCIHVLPKEIEMFERFMRQYHKSLAYLDEADNVTIKASLNLNPLITDWETSELKPDYFVNIFNELFDGIKNINEIIYDTSLMGTTQQKRESIELDYDQFIFVDTDIAFPEMLLKYQLEASYQLNGKYILIPQLVRIWDNTWDVLVHNDYIHKECGYHNTHTIEQTYNQPIDEIVVKEIPIFKFGCGMHTLYSKEFWNFIGIPESFGGYGSEDTFAMFASQYAKQNGYDIEQYVLDGVYITEDMINRVPSFQGKINHIFKKEESRDKSWELMNIELNKFINKNLINR